MRDAFKGYFRKIGTDGAVGSINDVSLDGEGVIFRPDRVTKVELPLPNMEREGLNADYRGVFSRQIANRRPELQFFHIGNQLFDTVTSTFWVDGFARTYSVICNGPVDEAWEGFDLRFRCDVDLEKTDLDPVLINRALEILSVPVQRVFIGSSGNVVNDGETEAFLANLVDGKITDSAFQPFQPDDEEDLPLVLDQQWADGIPQLVELGENVARASLDRRLAPSINAEISRYERERLSEVADASQEIIQDSLPDMGVFADALNAWQVRLDSIGFLSARPNAEPICAEE